MPEMKAIKRITMTLAFTAIFIISARGQGFQNLNFESAQNLPGNPGNGEAVPISNALLGWTAYDGSLVLSEVFFVSNSILGSATSVELEGGSLALSGNFSVGLFGDSSISQTGMIPDTAESLQFEAEGPGAGGSLGGSGFGVSLGGQYVPLSVLSTGPDYIVYGGNIPADMDGQTEALAFGCDGSGGIVLDNIEFSTSPIPEPGEFALIGLGAILFAILRLRKSIPQCSAA
jgi:hypothetical protein